MAVSDACADFLEDLANSLTEPKVLVRRLLVEVERYKSHGYAHGEIQTLQTACEAVLTAHPAGNWRRARLGSIVRLVILAEQVRAYHDAVVVTAHQSAKGNHQGHPLPTDLRSTLVLVRPADGWKLAGIHLSFMAGTPGAPPLPADAPPR